MQDFVLINTTGARKMPNDTPQAVFYELTSSTIPNRAKRPHSVPLIFKLIRLAFRAGGTISPQLAGRAAYKLWLTPARFPTPSSEQAVLESAEIEYYMINRRTIATYSWGQTGPTVLLVHGWSGRGTQLGAFVEPLINAGYRVLSFDGPAHGGSSGKQTNLYEIADVILGLNGRYGPFESVITHSFGGPCLAAAMQQGLNTSSVVSISPPASFTTLVDKFADTLSIPEKAVKDFVRRCEDVFGKDIFEQASMANNVRELDLPALVIHDEDDADIPWRDGQAVAQAWKNASFIKTSTLGHRRILRNPSIIEAAVDFIKSEKP
jgi:pimeloyl-ACP methyl ester carboxylesterase